jgi:hypothetical protein
MSVSINGKTFWCALNQASEKAITGINIPRGNGVRLPCAVFIGDSSSSAYFVDTFDNFVSASIAIRKKSATGDLLFSQTIAKDDFDDLTLTFEAWQARTSQLFTFTLSAAATNWGLIDQTVGGTGSDATSKWDGALYLAFAIDTSDAGPITLTTGTGKVWEDGIGDAGDPIDTESPAISEAQADARYARRVFVTWDGTFDMAGQPGDIDPRAMLNGQPGVAIYSGDGTTHGWLFVPGINSAT